MRSKTYNTFAGLRSILASNSLEAEKNGDKLVNEVKIYPLASAATPQRSGSWI